MASAPTVNRIERLNVRATPRQARLIRLAAKDKNSTVSSFLVESAMLRAEETLAAQAHFVYSPSQWKAFTTALDRPARSLPRLQKLMQEPSLLERRRSRR